MFPHPGPEGHAVARKLVYKIVARYGAFPELPSDQGTNFGVKSCVGGMSIVLVTQDKDYTIPPLKRRVHRTELQDAGLSLKVACRETKQEWDELVPLILMSYRATPQASTGVTPNMMMLSRQTRLPVQAMYGTPLGPEEEETTVSEYVAALQGGLRAVY